MATSNYKKKNIVKEVSTKKPLVPQTDKDNLKFLSFSFRYFTQIIYFGVGAKDATWFANLYDRLQDLSGKTSAILESKERLNYRLHPIDWTARNCPITKEELGLPKQIADNMEDDFIWQFQLSKGTGRVVGFFNDDYTVFYIVLLDPEHNIQPSKDYGYSVNSTEFALTDYEQITSALSEAEGKRILCKHAAECPMSDMSQLIDPDAFFVKTDPALAATYEKLIKDGSFSQAFNDFLMTEYLKES